VRHNVEVVVGHLRRDKLVVSSKDKTEIGYIFYNMIYLCSRREHLLSHIALLWEGFPHLEMTYVLKFFMLIQLSYWLHWVPEVYFLRMKRDEIPQKLTTSAIYASVVALAYLSK
jgi:hypothetical protein